jgi:hypothetical protein
MNTKNKECKLLLLREIPAKPVHTYLRLFLV